MKIAIFTDTYTPDINGVVSSVVTLKKGLEDLGHEVYIITSHKGFSSDTSEDHVYRLPGLEIKKLYGYKLGTPYSRAIRDEIAGLNLDVIHVQQEFTVSVFGRIVAHQLQIPVVYTYHTMYEDYTHYVNRFNLKSLDDVTKRLLSGVIRYLGDSVGAVIAPSMKTEEALRRYGVSRPIHIIPTGLDLEAFKRENVDMQAVQQLKETYKLDANTKLISYIGRVAQEKDIDIIVDGFQYVSDPNVKMMVVGGGPSLDDLIKQAKKLGIEDRIIFTDKQPSEMMPTYYALADAFVSPSLSETQGMTFIEALAAGLPVFARHDEVLDELVYENKTGFYFEDGKEFAKKVDDFFSLAVEKRVAFKEACQKVVEKYDVEQFAKHVESVYKEVIRDYEDSYSIENVRTSDDCMRLRLINEKSQDEVNLLVSLDDYVTFQLRKDGFIEYSLFLMLKKKEKYLLAYRACLRKIRVKDRTRKEMYDFLVNEEDPLGIDQINRLVETLESKGYINDEVYTLMYVERYGSSLSKKKLIRQLRAKGIPYEMIEQHLQMITEDDELAKAKVLARKYQDSIRNRSLKEKKDMIKNKLIKNGFTFTQANEVVEELDFDEDALKENVALSNAYDKAHRTYARKYSDKELVNRIIQYLLRKGFNYDDILRELEKRELHGSE
ncbi:1,2-diacylglycerol 3-alpha-glucosyltransferase [Breznakia blatticola]|uniref:Regulatory protein RecX n=1 Tax=Breznakia blatticola TaxID=1754012 RepID=A0A4R8A6F8_9FIRM|nr:RecX family transcriptional regulator [Breznakia blatticola]TDW26005.1 1,2-diacylglycerol 3-alpha-glucosyltransferase [Breznakia blatticola]